MHTGALVGSYWGNRQYTLPPGNYRLEFADQGGTYSFKVFQVPPPQVFTYTVGAVVSNGVPAAGAGNIETIASVDTYTVEVPYHSQGWRFRRISGSFSYTIKNTESGQVIATGSDTKTLPTIVGNHQISVSAATTGTYSFTLEQLP